MKLMWLVVLAASALVAASSDRPSQATRPSPRVIALWPEGVPDAIPNAGPEVVEDGRISNVHQPTLTVYPAPTGSRTRAAVIVCPGGAYTRLAIEKEGTAVAAWLNSLGVSAFVLKYRLKEYGHPAPLRDVLRAIRLVRRDADSLHVDPHRIGVMGFSAGGHLAASAGTLFDAPEGRTGAVLDATSARPDFVVLVYPVITFTPPYAHTGSRDNLLGARPAPELVARLSLESQVTAATPPTLLVHGGTDQSVPPENSVLFYSALRRAGVPAELHLYERGPHGFGLATDQGPVSNWTRRAAEWLAARGILSEPAPEARWATGVEGQRKADLGDGRYLNPIFDGTSADRDRYRYENRTLVLKARGTAPADSSPLWFVCGDHAYEVEVTIDIDAGATAGLLLFYSRRLYAGLGYSDTNFILHRYGTERSLAKPAQVGRTLHLRLVNDRHIVTIYYSVDAVKWERFGTRMEVSGYNHNVAYDFLSLRPALYAAGTGEVRFRDFRYRALP